MAVGKPVEEEGRDEDGIAQRDGRVINNDWLSEEVVTMIDESPDEEDHRWKGSNNDKESAI